MGRTRLKDTTKRGLFEARGWGLFGLKKKKGGEKVARYHMRYWIGGKGSRGAGNSRWRRKVQENHCQQTKMALRYPAPKGKKLCPDLPKMDFNIKGGSLGNKCLERVEFHEIKTDMKRKAVISLLG